MKNDRLRIVILGSSGLLGSRLVPFLLNQKHQLILSHDIHDGTRVVDVLDYCSAAQFFDVHKPDVIINLVALTNVDQCEKIPNLSYKINVKPVENVVKWIQLNKSECHLVHLSTDHLYDGKGPHAEDDISPTNYYAYSKYLSELIAAQVNASILRTNFFGKSAVKNRSSFTDWIYSEMSAGVQLNTYDDIFFNPLSMHSLVKVIEVVSRKKYPGTYNVGSKSGMSKSDFIQVFAKCVGCNLALLNRVSYDEFNFSNVRRPKDMTMNVQKFESAYQWPMKTLAEEIALVSQEYCHEC